MEYLFIALAVYWVLRFIEIWIEAPSWLWQLITLGASALALVPWNQSWIQWYSPFAIAGIVTLFQLVENFLIAKADEALTVIMKATARRPR